MGGVAVVGSINVDLTGYASPLPAPGQTVLGERFTMVLGGKGANQALAAVRAGAPTFLVGAVGADQFAELARSSLTDGGVDATHVVEVAADTGVAHIRVDTATAENDIVVVAGANDWLTSDHVERALRSLANQVSVVLMQLEIPIPVVQRVATLCPKLGLDLILDPAPPRIVPADIWPGVFLAKPNEHETAAITGIPVIDRSSAEQAGRWFLNHGVTVAVITRGDQGAVIVQREGVTAVPAYPVRAVDTTAAGDAFVGALGASLSDGAKLAEALRRALAASALSVTVRGASPSLPTAAAVDRFLSSTPPAET
jgi:ribokinase